jgi:hypothetical protein
MAHGLQRSPPLPVLYQGIIDRTARAALLLPFLCLTTPRADRAEAGKLSGRKLATETSLDHDAALAFSGIVLRGCAYDWIRQFVSRTAIGARRSWPSKHPYLSRHCCCFLLLRLENRAIELSCCFNSCQCRRLAISMSLEEITVHLTTRYCYRLGWRDDSF